MLPLLHLLDLPGFCTKVELQPASSTRFWKGSVHLAHDSAASSHKAHRSLNSHQQGWARSGQAHREGVPTVRGNGGKHLSLTGDTPSSPGSGKGWALGRSAGTIAPGSGAGTAVEGERPTKDGSQPPGPHCGPAQSRYSILPPGLQGAGSLRESRTQPSLTRGRGEM